jgi:hypothetical protein
VQNERTPDAKVADEGHDWRAEVGASKNSDRSVDLARSREPGRGREANTPEQIPPQRQTEAQKRNAAFAACQREADSAVPRLRTEQDEMNHYSVFAACAEKRGYHFGNGYGGRGSMNWWRG